MNPTQRRTGRRSEKQGKEEKVRHAKKKKVIERERKKEKGKNASSRHEVRIRGEK